MGARHTIPGQPAPETNRALLPDEQELSRLGSYQLLQPIGRGGMGRVFKAVHIHLKRSVALKVLPAERSDAATSATVNQGWPARRRMNV